MARLTLLLLLIASLPSTFSSTFKVFVDPSNCVHLLCEWRGEGEFCKSSNLLHRIKQRKTVPDAAAIYYVPHSDDETEDYILARIQSIYPLNTFTLVNDDVDVGEKCKGRRLWCNTSGMWMTADFYNFLKITRNRPDSPKFNC